jgi:hypothetical protein
LDLTTEEPTNEIIYENLSALNDKLIVEGIFVI